MTSLALIGAGPTTALHALAAKALGWEIACIASRDARQRDERARQIGTSACDIDDVPEGIDVALVTTAAKDHVSDARHLSGRVSAVIVEPPVAMSLADIDALVAIGEEHGIPVTYGDSLVYAPVVRLALGGVHEIGELVNLEANVTQPWPRADDPTAESYTGAALIDLGVNAVSLVTRALGDRRVTGVSAHLEHSQTGPGDASAAVELHIEGGLTAHVHARYGTPANTWDLQAASDTGVVRMELTPTLSLERDGDPVALPGPRRALSGVPQLEQYGYVGQLEAVGDDLTTGPDRAAGRAMGIAHARLVTEILCAAYSSAYEGGAVVALPFAGSTTRAALTLWYA